MEELVAQNIKYLRKVKGLTQDQLADKIGVNRAMIGSYEENRAVPKLSGLRVMAHYFGVTIDEFVNTDLSTRQNQSKIKDISGRELRVVSTIVDRDNKELITLVPVKAAAGYLNGYGDPDFVETLPRFSIPIPELGKDRTYRAFQIKGDSMEPIPSGAYLIAEYVANWNDIKDSKTYIFITQQDGIVYKRAYHKENGELLLKSDNPQYEAYSLKINELTEVWRALGYLSLELPEPENLSINKLSAMMMEMKKEMENIKKGTL